MNKSVVLSFVLGAAAGAVASWYVLKSKFERIAQEEIDSVKAAFSQNPTDELKESIEEEDAQWDRVEKAAQKEKYRTIIEDAGYKAEGEGDDDMNDEPYVIAPEEFGEMDGYDCESLVYYADGVLTDTWDNVIENPRELVGDDFASHFDENEGDEDTVYIQNDALNTQFEILRDAECFHDKPKPKRG